ncbi:MAG: response regulator transcription factor [Anaerotardibacter sp.]
MIYYVEDDTNIRDLALYALAAQGLEARGFPEGESFRKACEEQLPELVLLDVMLPGEDGFSILSWIRNDPRLCRVPVMMLTAKGTEYEKVIGLDAGADDYLAKPFGMMELASRCRALLRRAGTPANVKPDKEESITCGHLVLQPKGHRVFVEETEVELTVKEFDLLKKLMESPDQVFSRSQLLEDVWGITFAGETRTVDTHIQTLRKKLNEVSPGAGLAIETVRGVGYRISRKA